MDIELIVTALNDDKIGILPTDTVYGVVGRLFSEAAVKRIFEAKQRNKAKRVGTVLIADISQIENIVPPLVAEKASKYWPGPVSVVLSLGDELTYAHKGNGTLAFRIPSSPELIELLKRTGPLATSSANLEGQPPATTVEQAKRYFGDTVDFYVDGGDLSSQRPSRIIELLANDSEQEIRN